MRGFIHRFTILISIVSCETNDLADELTAPTITSITTHASKGGTVIITGANLSDASAVTFGGMPAASFTVSGSTSISAVVAGGRTGYARVVTPKGVAEFAGFVYSPEVSTCKLPELSGGDLGLGFPRSVLRVPSNGIVKVSVLFGDFSDSPASQSTQQVFEEHVSPSVQYLNAMSYGKLTVEYLPTHRWFRMSGLSTERGFPDNLLEVAALADPGTDFSESNAVFLVLPPDADGTLTGRAHTGTENEVFVLDNRWFYNAAFSGNVLANFKGMLFAHEFGHLLGLPDLYRVVTTGGWPHGFVGVFSVMGMVTGDGIEMFAYERWLLGWITDEQVVCQLAVGEGRVKLTPVERSGGTKLLVIPIKNSRAVVVECRRALGYDHRLTKEGPLAYLVDTRTLSGAGVVQVLPFTSNDLSKVTNIMNLKQTLNFENVSIKFVASDEEGDEIVFKKN